MSGTDEAVAIAVKCLKRFPYVALAEGRHVPSYLSTPGNVQFLK